MLSLGYYYFVKPRPLIWAYVFVFGESVAHLRGAAVSSRGFRVGATFILTGDEPEGAPGYLEAGSGAVRSAEGAGGLSEKETMLGRFDS